MLQCSSFSFNSLNFYVNRCGEDERPLNELLVLQLAAEHPNGRYYVPLCKPTGTYWNQEKNIIPAEADTNSVHKFTYPCRYLPRLFLPTGD